MNNEREEDYSNSRQSQTKYWMFTINNPSSDDFQNIKHIQYMIWQLEIGEKIGSVHVQGYVVFKCRKRLSTVSKLFPESTHLEVRRSKHSEAKGYCSKIETRIDGPWEIGDDIDIPEGTSSYLILDDTILKENYDTYLKYYKSIRKYKKLMNKNIKLEK